jgi:hypothetical protein
LTKGEATNDRDEVLKRMPKPHKLPVKKRKKRSTSDKGSSAALQQPIRAPSNQVMGTSRSLDNKPVMTKPPVLSARSQERLGLAKIEQQYRTLRIMPAKLSSKSETKFSIWRLTVS